MIITKNPIGFSNRNVKKLIYATMFILLLNLVSANEILDVEITDNDVILRMDDMKTIISCSRDRNHSVLLPSFDNPRLVDKLDNLSRQKTQEAFECKTELKSTKEILNKYVEKILDIQKETDIQTEELATLIAEELEQPEVTVKNQECEDKEKIQPLFIGTIIFLFLTTTIFGLLYVFEKLKKQ